MKKRIEPMALLNQPTQVSGQLGKFFEALRKGTAPDKFGRGHLKDIGFTSSNHLAFIPLLKGLNFLTSDGIPTQRYRDFLDETRSKKVLGLALREAYGDLFTIKAKPTKADKTLVVGKYKSTYNASEISAERSAATFLALLELADMEFEDEKSDPPSGKPSQSDAEKTEPKSADLATPFAGTGQKPTVPLNYNIQIHLPATKDLEVYNAIFKSLRSHLID